MSKMEAAIGILVLIIVLGFIAGIFLYIGNNVPKEMSGPFITIGSAALIGAILVIVLIIVIVVLALYAYSKR